MRKIECLVPISSWDASKSRRRRWELSSSQLLKFKHQVELKLQYLGCRLDLETLKLKHIGKRTPTLLLYNINSSIEPKLFGSASGYRNPSMLVRSNELLRERFILRPVSHWMQDQIPQLRYCPVFLHQAKITNVLHLTMGVHSVSRVKMWHDYAFQ